MSPRWPVSVKGVVLDGDHVVLLRNERAEWELPGGRLEFGESPEQALHREIDEELGLDIRVADLLDVWVYEVQPEETVLIVTFGCHCTRLQPLAVSEEHNAVMWADVDELHSLSMPDGYRASIRAWQRRVQALDAP